MNICRSKDGFIKLHYKMQDSDLWSDHNALVVFLRMIGFAHYEDDFTSIRFKGKQVYLKRGEFAASVSELAQLTNLSVGTLRDVLARLEADKRISKRSDNRITIFRICNYSKYQDVPTKKPANKPANDTTNDPANDPASPTGGKKNIKNIKKRKNNSAMVLSKKDDFDIVFEALNGYWSDLIGREMSDNKTARKALRELLEKRDTEKIQRAIRGAVYFKGVQYKPQVMSFASMVEKWDNLIGHMDTEKKKGVPNESNKFA